MNVCHICSNAATGSIFSLHYILYYMSTLNHIYVHHPTHMFCYFRGVYRNESRFLIIFEIIDDHVTSVLIYGRHLTCWSIKWVDSSSRARISKFICKMTLLIKTDSLIRCNNGGLYFYEHVYFYIYRFKFWNVCLSASYT